VIIFIGALVFYGRRSLILNAIVIVIAALISYAGISGTVTHLRALEDGTATGSYGVPLQDEEAAVAALAQRSLSEVDLCTVSTDSYRRAYEYLLGRKGINFTSEAMMQAVFYRVSENPDLASLTSDLSSFDQATFGTVGLLVGPKK
jgi:hypothetical protein